MNPTPTRLAAAALCSAAMLLPVASVATAQPTNPARHADRPAPDALHLGADGLTESRTTTTLQRGVTHTLIARGSDDDSLRWVVEVNMPAVQAGHDPDTPLRSIQDEPSARAMQARLAQNGFAARVERVDQPRVADLPAAVLGYRVRLVEQPTTKAEADALVAALKAKGFASRSWYTGWDGGTAARGPWRIHVLTIDPRTFRGTLGATYGPTLEAREKVTELSSFTRAKAIINAGFFVMDPTAGAEGDPAGAAVYDGRLVSETIRNRPVLVLDRDARRTRVALPTWRGSATLAGQQVRLDGINRVIGLIRNCGGDATDSPTSLPLHDVTCKDSSEAVAYTPAFGPRTPSGPGAEVVLFRGRVVAVNAQRGTVLGRGQTSIQLTGDLARRAEGVRVGQRAEVGQQLTENGRSLARRGTTVVNGGPELLRHGRIHITQRRDGMAQADNPSFAYGWVLQRNPRTFAGVDARGRTVLVTVDGRQTTDLGLSIPETAQLAKDLGLREAINLDGGGSTAMALDGRLVTSPSDATGERPVGDAIFVR
ncbi:phosphodiester glycosidase family protein [Luteococcus peritonei]|uniref:Phosphodiester glycosidase family protein n=1 Tax=Luteococcus peritonei TaxID=88874 RepID=A0ABW4RY96_9ACTN